MKVMQSSATIGKGRGFRSWDKEELRELSRMAGEISQAKVGANQFTPETARRAGLKSAEARRRKKLLEQKQNGAA